MSLTPEEYEKRKWRGLTHLHSALANLQLGGHHYGWSSAHYNKFEALSDLLQIGILVSENMNKIPGRSGEEVEAGYHEMRNLSQELRHNSEVLSNLARAIEKDAQNWVSGMEEALR